MVKWPCVIKHVDDDELVYLEDLSAWENDKDLQAFEYDETDFLVDASGVVYGIEGEGSSFTLECRDRSMELNDVLGLVKAHAASKGSCCVAKLYAPTILDAFMIVKSMDDE